MKMKNENYKKITDWDFSKFNIKSEKLTNWDMYAILNSVTNKDSKILDLGTGGGENLLKNFPCVKEILGIDCSLDMIETANKNLIMSNRENIKFEVMDNLNMDVPNNYYDVVVARNTVINPTKIYNALKDDGYLIVRGVDKYDCHELKLIFGKGQGMFDSVPQSIVDYENILNAGFKDAELVPIHEREYYESREMLYDFLLKVPIIDDFYEEKYDVKKYYGKEIDDNKLDKYIKRNTYDKGIRLIRRYYGIVAKK